MQKITPFLWFDTQAEEAATFYTSLFPNSRVNSVTHYNAADPVPDGVEPLPPGTPFIVNFQLAGQDFTAMNAGPEFSFTPAISFFVGCDSESEVDALFEKLSDGGTVLMPLQAYPFSERFAWVNDRYGVSWQLILAEAAQKIAPFLMFVGEQNGRAEEAVRFYTSLFPDSAIEDAPHSFRLHGQQFLAFDGGLDHNFTFTEAISLYVDCQTQEEVDRLWNSLTADGGLEQPCGWLKDRFGVSWQIVPRILAELMKDEDPEKARRVTEAMLKMTKIETAELIRAYEYA